MMKRFPAEWEPQSYVMLTWPHKDSDWAPILSRVGQLYQKLALELAKYVDVCIACDPSAYTNVKAFLENNKTYIAHAIQIYPVSSNDTWARDHGPISIIENGTHKLLNFTFNAWGNKFPCVKDNAINKELSARKAFDDRQMEEIDYVLEGGAIESDGNGTLMGTEACLLNPNRNGETNKDETEGILKNHFGASNIAWVNSGYLAGDDTDCHIDTLARFAPNNIIIYAKCSDRNDEHFESLQKMESCLEGLRNANGNAYQLIPLPFPDPIYNQQGDRLPATYANFLITNNAVFVPIYNVEQDDEALIQVAAAFPDHEITPINCRPLIEQHGSLHCITMQIAGPAPTTQPQT